MTTRKYVFCGKSAELVRKMAEAINKDDVGQPIPGSRYYRAYCVNCGAPGRVPDQDFALIFECEDCSPHQLSPHDSPLKPGNDEENPSFENAVRVLES